MKTYKIIGLSLTALFIFIFLGLLIYSNFVLIDVYNLGMNFTVSDRIGVNTDTNALYFGKAPPGGTSERSVNLTNDNNFAVFVSIAVNGEISSVVSVSENDFIIQPGELKTVRYYARAPYDVPINTTYLGSTRITIRRVI